MILLLLWIIMLVLFKTEVCLRGWDPKVENSHFKWLVCGLTGGRGLKQVQLHAEALQRCSLVSSLVSPCDGPPLQFQPVVRGHMRILLIYFYSFIYRLLNYMSTRIKARAFHNFILLQRIVCIWTYLRMWAIYSGKIAMWLLRNWGFGIVPFPRFLVLLQRRLWWWT